MLSFKGKGFTLIELLIAIVIIGLLATLVMVNIGGATSRARDSRRASDLKQMSTALELYYQEYNYYPAACNSTQPCWPDLLNDVSGKKRFIPLVPKDPKKNPNVAPNIYTYCNISNSTKFVIVASLENPPSQPLGDNPDCSTAGPNWFWVGN